ncbi:MAG: phage baseplate assembly protein V [Beijerinckiaceae bacterium]|nr:phage baseplate assembly protein V [Beijerinckiaceae bacterium]
MSDFAAFARLVTKRFADLEAENERLKLRLDNLLREGRVESVDPETGTAEVDMNGLRSDKLSWSQRAGSIRDWDPPSQGERVLVLNPSGDPGLGIIFPGGYSDAFPQPHRQAGEFFKQVGASSILMTGEKLVLTVGGSSFTLEAGVITLKSPSFKGVRG